MYHCCRQRFSLEEVKKELEEAEKKLENAEVALREASDLVTVSISSTHFVVLTSFFQRLDKSLKYRRVHWLFMRALMSLRLATFFPFLLSSRGFSGSVELDHERGELNLRASQSCVDEL